MHPDQSEVSASLFARGYLLRPVLGIADLCAALGIATRKGVLRLHRREGLPLARIGRRYYISRARFERWLDSRLAGSGPCPLGTVHRAAGDES
ncbi:MAG: helix-turn-helix domain-containing protein [Planctomycetes bacterium]|nr:helix-turn-helix domain-containing protein [Planctomycetota bacterium]